MIFKYKYKCHEFLLKIPKLELAKHIPQPHTQFWARAKCGPVFRCCRQNAVATMKGIFAKLNPSSYLMQHTTHQPLLILFTPVLPPIAFDFVWPHFSHFVPVCCLLTQFNNWVQVKCVQRQVALQTKQRYFSGQYWIAEWGKISLTQMSTPSRLSRYWWEK